MGRTVRLSREQLHWYQHTRLSFEADDRLYQFFEEYPATPEEAFQHAGRSIFGPSILERCKTQEKSPAAVVFVEPAKNIAQLKAWERKQAARVAPPVDEVQ